MSALDELAVFTGGGGYLMSVRRVNDRVRIEVSSDRSDAPSWRCWGLTAEEAAAKVLGGIRGGVGLVWANVPEGERTYQGQTKRQVLQPIDAHPAAGLPVRDG